MVNGLWAALSQQYSYFRSLNPVSQATIVARTVGGGMTFYASSDALMPNLGFALTLGFLGAGMYSFAAFNAEDKKWIRRKRHDFFVGAIHQIEMQIAELVNDTNQSLDLAVEETNKKLEQEESKERKKSKSVAKDQDFEAQVEKIKASHPNLDEKKLTRLINIARVAHARKKFANANREGAQIYAGVSSEKLTELAKLQDDMQSIQQQEEKIEADAKPAEVIAEPNSKSTTTEAANSFTAHFRLAAASVAGGLQAFIGGGSTVYVVLSNALQTNYTSPAVVVPSLIVGAAASGLGGRAGYHDRQCDVQEATEFEKSKIKLDELNAKYKHILAVNRRIKSLLYKLEDKPLEVATSTPVLSVATGLPVTEMSLTEPPGRRNSIFAIFSRAAAAMHTEVPQPGVLPKSESSEAEDFSGLTVEPSTVGIESQGTTGLVGITIDVLPQGEFQQDSKAASPTQPLQSTSRLLSLVGSSASPSSATLSTEASQPPRRSSVGRGSNGATPKLRTPDSARSRASSREAVRTSIQDGLIEPPHADGRPAAAGSARSSRSQTESSASPLTKPRRLGRY